MENNLADKTKDYMFEDEDHIIEKAEQIEILYQQLFISDEKKFELRQYILQEADNFNSKYEEVYGKSYMDNYFDFIKSDDFDDFEFRKKLKAGTFFYPKAIKTVVVTDSDSESEDEKSMFSETQSEADSDDSDASSSDSESEEEDDDETMYDSEEEEEDISNLDLEEEYRFYKNRTNKLDEELEEKVKTINERDEQIKNLKAVIDDLRTQKDENIEQIRQQNEDFDKMKKSRDHFEWLNKKIQENEIFLINQQNKTQDETAVKINERDDKIKELKKELDESEHKNNELEEKLERQIINVRLLVESRNTIKNELEEKYQGMLKDRQHFCKLNSDRWNELQKVKKQLEETIKVISNA